MSAAPLGLVEVTGSDDVSVGLPRVAEAINGTNCDSVEVFLDRQVVQTRVGKAVCVCCYQTSMKSIQKVK